MKLVAKEINLKIEEKIVWTLTMRAELGQDQQTTFSFR